MLLPCRVEAGAGLDAVQACRLVGENNPAALFVDRIEHGRVPRIETRGSRAIALLTAEPYPRRRSHPRSRGDRSLPARRSLVPARLTLRMVRESSAPSLNAASMGMPPGVLTLPHRVPWYSLLLASWPAKVIVPSRSV